MTKLSEPSEVPSTESLGAIRKISSCRVPARWILRATWSKDLQVLIRPHRMNETEVHTWINRNCHPTSAPTLIALARGSFRPYCGHLLTLTAKLPHHRRLAELCRLRLSSQILVSSLTLTLEVLSQQLSQPSYILLIHHGRH